MSLFAYLTENVRESQEVSKIEVKSAMAKNIHRVLFKELPEKNELFQPGETIVCLEISHNIKPNCEALTLFLCTYSQVVWHIWWSWKMNSAIRMFRRPWFGPKSTVLASPRFPQVPPQTTSS